MSDKVEMIVKVAEMKEEIELEKVKEAIEKKKEEEMKKAGRGGKRIGAGRKRGGPYKPFSDRVKKVNFCFAPEVAMWISENIDGRGKSKWIQELIVKEIKRLEKEERKENAGKK